MRILLTGGTGLIGRALCQHWSQQGHALYVWSRSPQQVPALCSGARGIAQLQELDAGPPLDAVVNLAGAPEPDRHRGCGAPYCRRAPQDRSSWRGL